MKPTFQSSTKEALSKATDATKILYKTRLIYSLLISLKSKCIVLVGYGSKVHIEKDGLIRSQSKKSKLYIGLHYSGKKNTTVIIKKGARLEVGNNVVIARGCKIAIHPFASLRIGENSSFNEDTRVYASKSIEIGANCSVSWNCSILDSDEHRIFIENKQKNPPLPVRIGDNVWIGLGTTIAKGTFIENNCIVGANSFTKGHLKSQKIYAGTPVREISKFEKWM